jgi:transposase-like protein
VKDSDREGRRLRFKQEIDAFAKERKLSKHALAEFLGVNLHTLQYWRHVGTPNNAEVQRVIEFCRLNLPYI